MRVGYLKAGLFTTLFIAVVGGLIFYLMFLRSKSLQTASGHDYQTQIQDILAKRQAESLTTGANDDPFGPNGRVSILIVGLDNRAGETAGHCDAIQFVELDKNTERVQITAVPRGTYSPLPQGVATSTTDYYISNACGLVGLDYGLEQIERVLGQKADYLVLIGFSRALGIVRELQLPATQTLQWLRHRQGYAIGEPQRAHNHSTFLKQMMIKFASEPDSKLDLPFHYLIYKMIQTDLSFAQAKSIISFLNELELADNPEKISLYMKPRYEVRDIAYDPNNVDEYLKRMIEPIKGYLGEDAYSGQSHEEIEQKLLKTIQANKFDPQFTKWAYHNALWQQFEDENQRLSLQFDLTQHYVRSLPDQASQQTVIKDYLLEMQYRDQPVWLKQGQSLLEEVITCPIKEMLTLYYSTWLIQIPTPKAPCQALTNIKTAP